MIPKPLGEEMQYEQAIGIPRGRFSSLPGFGIHTLRTGEAFPFNDSVAVI
jgi:hypothetical protein